MGAAAGLGAAGQAIGITGGERGRKGAKRGFKQAAGEFQSPASLTSSGAAYPLFGTKDASVFQNLGALLSGNSLDELQPALRSADIGGRNQQRSFAGQLARSGLTGSGFGLGNNQAIANQTDVNKSNILAQLPALRRENLAAALPYFQTFMADIARRQSGRAGIKERSAGTNAAAKTESSNNMGNMVSSAGMGKGGGGGK